MMKFEGVYIAKGGEKVRVGYPTDFSLFSFKKKILSEVGNKASLEDHSCVTDITCLVKEHFDLVDRHSKKGDPNLSRYNEIYEKSRNGPYLGKFVKEQIGTCREVNLTLGYVLAAIAGIGSELDFVRGLVGVGSQSNYNKRGGSGHGWIEYRPGPIGEMRVADAIRGLVVLREDAYNLFWMFGGVEGAEVVKLR